MPIGNDVVDLRDPESQPGAIHARWDSRVFTAQELNRLGRASSPHRTRWKLWAAKESAFKVARKIDPRVPFFPSAFAVELIGRASAHVHHEVGRLEVWLEETAEYVHAVATPQGSSPPFSRLERLRPGALARPGGVRRGHPTASLASAQVREVARIAIGSMVHRDPSRIEISGAGGVPVASAAGVELPVDLSLSHHGRFLACAWLLPEDADVD